MAAAHAKMSLGALTGGEQEGAPTALWRPLPCFSLPLMLFTFGLLGGPREASQQGTFRATLSLRDQE